MEMLQFSLALSLSVLLCPQPANGEGVFLKYNEAVLNDFIAGTHEDVGLGSDESQNNFMICGIDNSACCEDNENSNGPGFGDWYYPSGARVVFGSEDLPSGEIYQQQRGSSNQTIRLQRAVGIRSNTPSANGIYRCEVADENGVNQTRYVGLYTETTDSPKGVGVISIFEGPDLSVIRGNPLVFTLTTITTGGPPTVAFWTLPNGTKFNVSPTSQAVLDYKTSTVSHTLTLTEALPGEYTFTTTNRRSGLEMSSITLQAANPPADLMAVQSGPNSIRVSWIAPAPGGPTRTGYRIFYETVGSEENITVEADATSHTLTDLEIGETYNISIATLSAMLPSDVVGPEMVTVDHEAPNPPTNLTAVQSGPNSVNVSWTAPAPVGPTRTGYRIFFETDDSEESITVEADATSHTLTDLELGETYNISIVVLSAILPSDVVGPEMITIEEPTIPDVLARVLTSTSIAVSFIQLSGPPAERYDIEYTRVTGTGQILCPGVRHAGNITDVHSPYFITDLEEFSNYTVTVTAHFFNSTVTISAETVQETLQAVPTGFPMNLAVRDSIEATSITIGWRPVTCIERNGVIRNYIVRYGPVGGEMENATVTGQIRSFTASGLTPFTEYTFEVAAENSAGIGPFTLPLIVTTTEDAAVPPLPPSGLTVVQSGLNSVDVSWTAPAPGGPTRTGYRIFIETVDSEENITVEAVATSHTLTDLELGETYKISIVALSSLLPSEMVGPEMVTIEEPMVPDILTRVLNSTSIAVNFTQLSRLPDERYDIEYTRVTGAGQALCGSVRHSGNKTDVLSPYTITDLEEFSNYTITVTAHFFNSTVTMSVETVEETLQAAPTGFPMDLTVRGSIETTSITIRWRQVTCIERNGVIHNYTVRYGQEGGEMEIATVPGRFRRFTADGLTPSTEYTFEVAAENSAGRGPFTLPLIVTTIAEAPTELIDSVVVFVDTAAITIAWNQPASPNGVIQEYGIEYCNEAGSTLVNVSHSVRDPLDRPLNRVNRETSKVLTGLKPDTMYNITITPYYNTHQGNLTSFTATTLSIPRVPGYNAVRAVSTTAVEVSWFAVEIAHVREVYYKLRYHISSRPSDSSTRVVSDGLTSAVVDLGSPEVAELEHTFSVAVAYKIEEEEFEGEFSVIPQRSGYNVVICYSDDEGSNGGNIPA